MFMSLKYILYLEKIDVWNTVVQKFEKNIVFLFNSSVSSSTNFTFSLKLYKARKVSFALYHFNMRINLVTEDDDLVSKLFSDRGCDITIAVVSQNIFCLPIKYITQYMPF